MASIIRKFYSSNLPYFPKICVSQGCFCCDAFVEVVGEHLIQQRQSWSRAVRN